MGIRQQQQHIFIDFQFKMSIGGVNPTYGHTAAQLGTHYLYFKLLNK
ncbi:hypothetical protein EPK97_00720 [Chengkuizengella sediminis]|nr:hypothetical protein [Chengkuizengella sediminis]